MNYEVEYKSSYDRAKFQVMTDIPFLGVRILRTDLPFRCVIAEFNLSEYVDKADGLKIYLPYNIVYNVEFFSVVTNGILKETTVNFQNTGASYAILPMFLDQTIYKREERLYKISLIK
jgi:hypothetical protein